MKDFYVAPFAKLPYFYMYAFAFYVLLAAGSLAIGCWPFHDLSYDIAAVAVFVLVLLAFGRTGRGLLRVYLSFDPEDDPDA